MQLISARRKDRICHCTELLIDMPDLIGVLQRLDADLKLTSGFQTERIAISFYTEQPVVQNVWLSSYCPGKLPQTVSHLFIRNYVILTIIDQMLQFQPQPLLPIGSSHDIGYHFLYIFLFCHYCTSF